MTADPMPHPMPDRRIALLIDADNIFHTNIAAVPAAMTTLVNLVLPDSDHPPVKSRSNHLTAARSQDLPGRRKDYVPEP